MNKLPLPTEEQEQIQLISWTLMQQGQYPELLLLYHVPNGGSRNELEAQKLHYMGVKSGVPDLVLPVARGEYHGLYLEMKRRKGGRVEPSQQNWIDALRRQGYAVCVCKGFDEAKDALLTYLKLTVGQRHVNT